MIAAACLEYEEYSMYQKNIILITSIFLLFGCMDKTKLNNDGDAASIEKKRLTKLVSLMTMIGKQPMTIQKNLDWPMCLRTYGQRTKRTMNLVIKLLNHLKSMLAPQKLKQFQPKENRC